jgi:hypothetical protein
MERKSVAEMTTDRICGSCTACCKLVPVESLQKPAGEKCPHQRHRTGCAIYARRPFDCRVWNCRWLVNDGADDLPRPDHAHYVLDIMPDFIHQVYANGDRNDVQVMQLWVDPAHRDAWREPRCMAYIEKMAATRNLPTVVRYSSTEAVTVFAPAIAEDGQWHEVDSVMKSEDEAGFKYMLNRLDGG